MTLNNLIENFGIDKINSFTKYPSIYTYHELGDKGSLKDSLVDECDFSQYADCYITEKIDGTNSRIVIFNGDYLIGSRENFLYAKGDRFGDPSLNITNTIKSVADKLCDVFSNSIYEDLMFVIYGETYGGNITSNSKQYTENKAYCFRMFDYTSTKIDNEIINFLSTPIENIASWREHDGQKFASVENIHKLAKKLKIDCVPYINIVDGNTIPTSLNDVFNWLQNFSATKAGINAFGKSEGVVVRTKDRNLIRKIRFEDYERTKKRGGF